MKKSEDNLHQDAGFTLVELIASITIFTILVGLISVITFSGLREYNRITIENALRDEGDLIMSSIMTELYTFAPESIENSKEGIVLSRGQAGNSEHREIAIREGSLVIEEFTSKATLAEEEEYISSTAATSIRAALDQSIIVAKTADERFCQNNVYCESGLIYIKLVLQRQDNDRDYSLELESKFGF